MKTKNLLLAALLGLTSFTSFAHGSSKVWAQITDVSAVPFVNADGQLVSNHNSLNAAIQQQGIVEVRATDGVYFYRYQARDNNEQPFEGHGFLHLVR
ncbi:MAG: hypothetical protein ACK5F0_11365 [Flavobacteriales bacterium]|jgi:flagellar basal body rod protein FlgF